MANRAWPEGSRSTQGIAFSRLGEFAGPSATLARSQKGSVNDSRMTSQTGMWQSAVITGRVTHQASSKKGSEFRMNRGQMKVSSIYLATIPRSLSSRRDYNPPQHPLTFHHV